MGYSSAHPSSTPAVVGQVSVASIPNHFNASQSELLPNGEVNVFAGYDKEPAPMGIADYGIGPNGPYTYSTNSSLGIAGIVSLSAENATGGTDVTIQLNVNLQFTVNSQLYDYWVQDVAFLDTSNNLVFFANNIWNFSSPTAIMHGSGVSGSGSVQPDGKNAYYAAGASGSLPGNNVRLTYPTAIEFEVDSTVNGSGQPVVTFSYDDGPGMETYDSVTFLTTGKLAMPGFTVDGSSYNPLGIFYDSELVVAGPGDGLSTKDISSDVRTELYYFNGHNYEEVPNSYNFGSDTAETISNVEDQWYYIPADGENLGDLQPGSGSLGALYDSSEIGTFVYTSQDNTGILEIQNATDSSAVPDEYPFTGGQATITVYPGDYLLELSENGVVTSLGTYTVNGGQTVDVPSTQGTVQLTMSYEVQGGGSGYSAPVLTYTLDGKQGTATLTTTPTVYNVDIGSTWSVSSSLPGSTSSQRWATEQATNGTANSVQTFQFAYQYQFMVSADYSVAGGGSPAAPLLSYTSFSSLLSVPLTASPVSLWVDSDSSFSVPAQLTGSSSSNERWETATSTGTFQAPMTLTIDYFHQYLVTPLYSVKGGGSGYGTPSLTCSEFGAQTNATEGSPVWADAGSSCDYQQALPGSSSTVRWGAATPDVSVSAGGGLNVVYYYQYSLSITLTVVGGAPTQSPTLTGTAFGVSSVVSLSASSNLEWLDVGSAYSLSNPTPSSSSSERWYTTGTTGGTLSAPGSISLTYYHQYFVSAEGSIVGGGSPTAPSLSYVSFGSTQSLPLTSSVQQVWADSGSHYSAPTLLGGSSASERWSSSAADAGTIQSATTLLFTYDHQYFLTTNGGGLTSQWYNASSTATLTVPGVSGRASGSGERTASYTVDSGSPTTVTPTTGNITITVTMNAPHTLTINSVGQYEVSLDASVTAALSSITPPTISGDSYWYDQGTQVTLVLNGVWDRSGGTGERLVSYSVGGTSQAVSTTGTVQVETGSISSPVTVTGVVTKQYSLTTGTGSIVSETQPTISGDQGWYDSGTQVSLVYNYVWDSSSGSRQNALSYSVDGASTTLPRSGSGTFPVDVTMNAAQTVAVTSVTQYSLSVSGGYDVSLSTSSPTADGFYDAGSNVSATTDYTWGLSNGDARQNLVSFTLDSATTNVTTEDTGTFTTPAIVLSSPQTLVFNSVTQYIVAFQFKDSTGAESITPTAVEIQLDDPTIISVPASGVWLDSGTKFQLYQVEWEGEDVKPAQPTVYTADAPINQTVMDQVYSGTIVAKDYLGLPISGAQVSVTLANGTTIQRTTASDGSVALGEIPLGPYTATISYLGTKTSISGNASTGSTAEAKLFASYPTFGLIAAIIVVVIVALFLAVRRRHQPQQAVVPPPAETPPAEAPAVETPSVEETPQPVEQKAPEQKTEEKAEEKVEAPAPGPVAAAEVAAPAVPAAPVAPIPEPEPVPSPSEAPIVVPAPTPTPALAPPTTVVCPACGAVNNLPADFCQNCGKPLQATS